MESYYNMGKALKEQGKLEEAIEAYKSPHYQADYATPTTSWAMLSKTKVS